MAKTKDPTVLTPGEGNAAQAYVANGGDQSNAIREAFPQTRKWKDASVWVKASRVFNQAKVQLRIRELQAAAAKRAEIDKAETLKQIGAVAFSDMRQAFDRQGNLLPVIEWPDSLAAAVASVDVIQTDTQRVGDVASGEAETEVVTRTNLRLASGLTVGA